jgi:hypothetical protein
VEGEKRGRGEGSGGRTLSCEQFFPGPLGCVEQGRGPGTVVLVRCVRRLDGERVVDSRYARVHLDVVERLPLNQFRLEEAVLPCRS